MSARIHIHTDCAVGVYVCKDSTGTQRRTHITRNAWISVLEPSAAYVRVLFVECQIDIAFVLALEIVFVRQHHARKAEANAHDSQLAGLENRLISNQRAWGAIRNAGLDRVSLICLLGGSATCTDVDSHRSQVTGAKKMT